MSFRWQLGIQFQVEFQWYPQNQKEAVLKFIETYQQHGLGDFSKYTGKVSPSYKNIDKLDPIYDFTFTNNLWHYHLGLPEYLKSKYNDYLTSDMILHFQRKATDHIKLLDITWHYKADGTFWLPSQDYLI